MSLLILVSILIRLICLVWATNKWRREKDWRFGTLAVFFLALIAQVVPWEALSVRPLTSFVFDSSRELLDLFVSILAMSSVWMFFQRFPSREIARADDLPNPGNTRLAWMSIGIAAFAIAGCIVAGWLAYSTSRQAIMDAVAHENLSIGQSVVNQVEYELKQEKPNIADVEQIAITKIARAWVHIQPPYPASFLCVINASGRLSLHSERPEMKGTDVSNVIANPRSSNPLCVKHLLASKQSIASQNWNFAGKSQIVGYAHMPTTGSLVVVHVPSRLVDGQIRRTVLPWVLALALIGGFLIPASVGLLHFQYRKARRVATESLQLLEANKQNVHQRYLEIELLYQTAPVGLCLVDKDLRFVRINELLASIHDLPVDEHIGKSMKEILPDIAEIVEPICTHVIDTGKPVLGVDIQRPPAGKSGHVTSYLVNFHPLTEAGTSATSVSIVVQDVTELLRAKSELSIWQAAIDKTVVPTSFCDDEFHLTNANQAFVDLFGFEKRAQLIGQSNTKLQTCPTSMDEINGVISEQGTWIGEVTATKQDGTPIPLFGWATLLRDDKEKPICSIMTFWDLTHRKRTEEQLRFAKFSVDSCSTMIFWIRKDASFFYINDSAAEHFGYPRDELMSMSVPEIDPAYPLEIWPKFWNQMKSDRTMNFETSIRHKDGELIPVEITTNLLEFEGQEFVFAFVTDITDRKKTEAALRESEKLFRNLVETAPFGVQRNDVDGLITFANAELGKIFGCEPKQLVGRYIWDFAIDDEACLNMKSYVDRQSRFQPMPLAFETKNRTLDGRIIDVLIDWTYDRSPNGEVTGFIVIVTDISQRKTSERALEFQADILNKVSDAVFVSDCNGKITYSNESAKRIYGGSDARKLTDTFPELQDDFSTSVLSNQTLQTIDNQNKSWHGESEIQVKGETRHVETQLKTYQSSDVGDRLLLSVLRDVTARKKAEQESRKHREMLAHMTRLNSLGEMTAGIAHEVKQPLHTIANFGTAVSIALQKVELEKRPSRAWFEELNEWNSGILDAAQRAGEIIRRLQQFGQRSEREWESLDINQVLHDSIELVAFEGRQCRAAIETIFAEDLPNVIVDRIQCEQVAVNLLHNAFEALSDIDPPRRVIVRTRRDSNFVEIQIEDNGTGIPPHKIGKLFETFYTTKTGGMGMGLAISRTIVEHHGGRIWAVTNEQGGATFCFTLPIH